MDRESVREVGRTVHGSSDDPEVLDFSANTNSRTPPGTETVYQAAFDDARRYPREPPERFGDAAASFVGCDPEQVVPMPGGLAAIRLAIALAVDPGDTVLIPAPSFGEYEREVRLRGGDPVYADPGAIVDADPSGHAMVVVCTPNNPTGHGYARDSLDSLAARCRDSDTPLLLDEAFLGFTDRRSMAGTDGVVVARALTKLFGLPGIRAGFAVATGESLADLRTARRTWNVSGPALAVGAHCLADEEFVSATRARVRSERARLRTALDDRYDVRPSQAPFLLLDAGAAGVDAFLSAVAECDIAVRDARSFQGLDNHVRVAVREPAENGRLITALTDV